MTELTNKIDLLQIKWHVWSIKWYDLPRKAHDWPHQTGGAPTILPYPSKQPYRTRQSDSTSVRDTDLSSQHESYPDVAPSQRHVVWSDRSPQASSGSSDTPVRGLQLRWVLMCRQNFQMHRTPPVRALPRWSGALMASGTRVLHHIASEAPNADGILMEWAG